MSGFIELNDTLVICQPQLLAQHLLCLLHQAAKFQLCHLWGYLLVLLCELLDDERLAQLIEVMQLVDLEVLDAACGNARCSESHLSSRSCI